MCQAQGSSNHRKRKKGGEGGRRENVDPEVRGSKDTWRDVRDRAKVEQRRHKPRVSCNYGAPEAVREARGISFPSSWQGSVTQKTP